MRRWLRLAGVLLLGATPAAAETQTQCIKNLVCIEISHNDDYATIFVRNKLRVPAGIQIQFQSLRNLTPVPRLRKPNLAENVVPPGAETQILTLVRDNSQLSASFPFQWKFSYGDPGAKHDDSTRYRMPFGGTRKRVLTQGANGSFTHNGSSAWAFDFGMPTGTPILAARAGVVVEMTDGYTKSGISESFLDKANAVTILHDDSTFASYAHLDPGSGVRDGMRVNPGEVLGFSGSTGFSTGPHLHFSVWKATWEGGHTIPIRFHDGRAGGFLPEENVAYQPGCHTDGIPCKPGELPAAPAGAAPSDRFERRPDGVCRCRNGALITTKLPCRAVCP